jgi:ADP-ribosylglycohydrolase
MLGAILGDIIGSRFEFSKLRKNKSEEFDLFTDCYFTDDTVMTIATADAIMNNKDFTKTYQEWGRKYPDRGYGGMFHSWLFEDNPKPYNSFGNGSAMRVSPVGWLYNDLKIVFNKAEETAEVIHNHIEGLKGAAATAGCIYLANMGTRKKIIKEFIETYFNYDLNRTIKDIKPIYRFDVTCQGSVPESIICFLEGNSYEDVVRKAISLGGDTDTMGCIAGSIAEAYYGIPKEIKAFAYNYLPEDMLKILDQFNKKIS